MPAFLDRASHDALYECLHAAAECGPFDGGCYLFARALQMELGGDIHMLVSRRFAEHAVLKVGDLLLDAGGAYSEKVMLRRFNREELTEVIGARPEQEGDLPEAPRDETVSRAIQAGLSEATKATLRALTQRPQPELEGRGRRVKP